MGSSSSTTLIEMIIGILAVSIIIILLPPAEPPLPNMRELIIFGGISLAVAIALLEYIVYVKSKLRYGKSGTEALKLGTILLISIFKDTIIYASRLLLIYLITYLPMAGIVFFTSLYVPSITYVLSFNAPPYFWAIAIGSLLANILIIHYFLGKYGAIYKLPFIVIRRNDIAQFLTECIGYWGAILANSLTYFVVIYILLSSLLEDIPILSKISVGAIVLAMVLYVLPNKKYENAMSLWRRITNCG
ncbi:MAG: hypothetical protein JHC26_00485 [Thermofilum sp.]|uniref:hypothetical protein n=1 Tax=Thermofilum sp. TaxID=1961369 RepID=UPI0025840C27|nr:hypothetical protein [Thermofilum sp.]MCI4407542.1 hypothetical protein [Thermofilum sp.]